MRVLFVTPECAPLTKTGGLGDVSAALPVALRALGHDVRILIPGYREVLAQRPDPEQFFVLDRPELYKRDGGPYQDAAGENWPDNPLRFGALCRAAAELAASWDADVIHCNDWPTALIPLLTGAPTVMTVHNLAFQGNFEAAWVDRLGVPREAFTMEGAEFHGQLSFLKGGLAYAGAITTVSPTYAREIQSAEFGCGLDGLLRRRAGDLTGILNGIDTEVWDPARDQHLQETYDSSCLEKKTSNKTALQERMGLEARRDVPLLGIVSRLTHQKGIDLVVEALEELVALPAQLAVLGSGEREHEARLLEAARRHPGKVAARIGFDEALAHQIEAGADLFLMPSRFEPCGLNQMYSQRYGTPPVARATGGLADTIADGATGFLFERAEATALAAAVRRAVALWRDQPRWLDVQRRGMARDFGWAAAAARYGEIYARLAVDRPAAVP